MLLEELEAEAFKLKLTERARLAEALLSSLDSPDETIQNNWVVESEKRYKAFKAGQITGTSLDKLKPKLSS